MKLSEMDDATFRFLVENQHRSIKKYEQTLKELNEAFRESCAEMLRRWGDKKPTKKGKQ